MKLKTVAIIVAIVIVVAIIAYKKDAIMEFPKNIVWDVVSESRIKKLHPKVIDFARMLINETEKQLGIRLRVTDGIRTFEQQTKLYAQGRTTPGNIVTHAKAGESMHNYGLAIDVCAIINGNASWDIDFKKVAAIAKNIGWSWGGDWKTFKDTPHFEMPFGKTVSQLKSLYASGNTVNGFVNV